LNIYLGIRLNYKIESNHIATMMLKLVQFVCMTRYLSISIIYYTGTQAILSLFGYHNTTKKEKEYIHLLKNAYSPVRSIIYHKKQNLKIQYACIAYFALINKKKLYMKSKLELISKIGRKRERNETNMWLQGCRKLATDLWTSPPQD